MNKQIRFFTVSVWILFSRAYDAYSTYRFTPDLSKEANPLASVFHLGWTPILLIVGMLSLWIVYAYYQSIFRPFRLLPNEKGYHFGEFMSYLYLGKKAAFIAVFYKLPTDLKRLTQYMGEGLAPCLVYVGIISTLMWLGIHHSAFYKSIHNVYLIYTLIISGSLVILYRWNLKLYQQYQAE